MSNLEANGTLVTELLSLQEKTASLYATLRGRCDEVIREFNRLGAGVILYGLVLRDTQLVITLVADGQSLRSIVTARLRQEFPDKINLRFDFIPGDEYAASWGGL